MKTLFKLTALAAVSFSLVAGVTNAYATTSGIAITHKVDNLPASSTALAARTAAKAALESSRIAADWTTGTATTNRSVDGNIIAKYGTGSDLGIAHAAGWKGQGQIVLNVVTNLNDTQANNFALATSLVAPQSVNFNYGNLTVANAPASYVAFVTTTAQYMANRSTNMSGVMVKSNVAGSGAAATYVLGSRNATVQANVLLTVASPVSGTDITATFNGINTGNATVNASMTQQAKVAYIAGSASVIQSKFTALNNVETVNYMNSTTEAGGIFRLGTTLAPRAVR